MKTLTKETESVDIAKIDQIACEHMADSRPNPDREPGFILHHCRRTALITLRMAEQINVNVHRDILYTGALFHDVGKGTEPHNETGAHLVRDLLCRICQEDELDRICEIVRLHNQRGKSNDYAPEIKVVQDADYLDHVGLLGVWIALYCHGTRAETIDDALRYFHGDERASALAYMRMGLNFDLSVRIFDQRVDDEARFFNEFERVHQQGI
jgi:uncharacterized protein